MMRTVEFETELGNKTWQISDRVLASLPSSGKATVFVCVDLDPEDLEWRKASYAEFLRDDSEEDEVYDKYR